MEPQELMKLALKSLLGNKMRSVLTTLGVIIGVFAVILLVSVGTGLQKYITNQITGLGSNLIFVVPGKIGGDPGAQINRLTITDADILERELKDIADVGPIIQSNATLKYKNNTAKTVSILGTTANYPDIVKTEIEKGAFFTSAQERSGSRIALIGKTTRKNLFGTSNPIGQRISIAGNRYTVVGILKERGSVFGVDQDNTAVIPITAAKRLFGVSNVNAIYLSAKNSEVVPQVTQRAQKLMEKRLSEDDFTIQTQEQTLSTVNNITGVLTIALGGIAAISLIVGGIGVMNIMLVSVTERTKEIGLRKALGAKRKDVLLQFLLEAVILSLLGGVIGIILGLGASYALAQLFISEVTPWSVFLAFGFSVLVGVVFGITPALRASKLSPIEALRYE